MGYIFALVAGGLVYGVGYALAVCVRIATHPNSSMAEDSRRAAWWPLILARRLAERAWTKLHSVIKGTR